MSDLFYLLIGTIFIPIPLLINSYTKVRNYSQKLMLFLSWLVGCYFFTFVLAIVFLFGVHHLLIVGKVFYALSMSCLYFVTTSLLIFCLHAKKIKSIHIKKYGLVLALSFLNLVLQFIIMGQVFGDLNKSLSASNVTGIVGFGFIVPLAFALLLGLINILKTSLIIVSSTKQKLLLQQKKLNFFRYRQYLIPFQLIYNQIFYLYLKIRFVKNQPDKPTKNR